MPLYVYECDNCHDTFELRQGFNDKPLKKCKACGKHKLFKVPQIPHTFVYQPPKTLGHLASKNRDRMSEDEKHAIDPEGLAIAKKREANSRDAFGNKMDKDLFKMNPNQLRKFVETGDKPDFEGMKDEANYRRNKSRRDSPGKPDKRAVKNKVL